MKRAATCFAGVFVVVFAVMPIAGYELEGAATVAALCGIAAFVASMLVCPRDQSTREYFHK